ncbi:angiopoietin-related protein 2-like [Sabethes cyaneus]|uniref:angiopoietin-related protein 2-like n=1 Tax=Sabethes cyaneus TaxID=53552 RepID=UPI00237D4DD5|nr:angiopoietin-related protein 2-like [Sabethes cyaneus]
MLAVVIVIIAFITRSTVSENNASVYNTSDFGFELIMTKLEAINFNIQQINSSQQVEMQSLKRTLEEIKTLITNCSLVWSQKFPQTCAEATVGLSGLYRIQLRPGFTHPFDVYCDQQYEDGGWTVIQNRYDGSVDFFRGWDQYEEGFGDMHGEFWLGLRKIHELTYAKPHKLHVVTEDIDGTVAVAKYSRFQIGDAKSKYFLKSLGRFSGTGGDSLTVYHKGMKFSTFDSDNDKDFQSCARQHQGAWWYNTCGSSNLNGLYREGGHPFGMYWLPFHGAELKSSRMMIKVISEKANDDS